MKVIDINCYIGQWPFRKLRRNTIGDLKHIHAESGIEYGYVSFLNSIFYNDPFEGEDELHEVISGTPYRHIMTINPLLPEWKRDIDRGLKEMDIKGVKIFPGCHGYSLQDEAADRLCGVLESRGLPLFIVVRMEDGPLDYLTKQRQLSTEEICGLIRRHEANAIILIGMNKAEFTNCGEAVSKCQNVYFDTSGIRNLFGIEALAETFGADKMLYGSQFPLYCLKSSFLMTGKAQIDEKEKERIFYGNARRVLHE